MSMRAFYRVRCLVNNAVYTIAEVNIEDTVGDIDISNTEGKGVDPNGFVAAGQESHLPGLKVARITARNASFDDTDNPFASPLQIQAGMFISFVMLPNGPGFPAWVFPSVLVLSTTHGGQIKGAQPVGFTGVSSQMYWPPVPQAGAPAVAGNVSTAPELKPGVPLVQG